MYEGLDEDVERLVRDGFYPLGSMSNLDHDRRRINGVLSAMRIYNLKVNEAKPREERPRW